MELFVKEFKLNLTKEQAATLDTWRDILGFLWNRGLSILEWRKHQDNLIDCQFQPRLTKSHKQKPIPDETLTDWGFQDIAKTSFQYKKVGETTDKKNVWGLCFSRTVSRKVSLNDYPDIKSGNCHVEEFSGYTVYSGISGLEHGFIVREKTPKGELFRLHYPGVYLQKPHYSEPCPIATYKDLWKINTGAYIRDTEKHIPEIFQEYIASGQMCSRAIQAKCRILVDTWFGNGSPKYKGKCNPLLTIQNNNAAITKRTEEERKQGIKGKLVGSTAKIKGDRIKLPKLPEMKVKGLKKRWGNRWVTNYKITKKASGYYLQLTGQRNVPACVSGLKVREKESERKVVGIDAGVACLFADSDGVIHEATPTRSEVVREKRLLRLQKELSRRTLGGKNWQKTKEKIGKLHEKLKRMRRARDHYHSTMLVREYDAIAVEALSLGNMTKASKVKVAVSEEGKLEYGKNRRKAKSGLNRAMLRNTHGQRVQLIKSKVDAVNKYFGRTVREFTSVPPAYTSQKCNKCGHIHKDNRLSQAEFKCLNCGHTDHADTNASKNIRDLGMESFTRTYPALQRGT